MPKEESLVRIVKAPPPSPENGYELVYSYGSTVRTWRTNKKPKSERMGLMELLTTPGLNIVFASTIGGIGLLAYILYLYITTAP